MDFFNILFNHYSLRSAITGSFLAAFLDGIKPPSKVNMTLSITKLILDFIGRTALIPTLVSLPIMAFIGIISNRDIQIPIAPENKPIINVSALKIDDIFLLLAPIALSIPISLVRSKTDI